MKKLVLLSSTAALFVAPSAAFAQSTGTVTTEEQQSIVVTGTRVSGVAGVQVPDTTKAKGVITQELIQKQVPGQTILNVVNLVPGVNFTNNDPYGSSGGNIRIRGFDGNRISLTVDGIPLNDSGNYAIFSNQQVDPELIDQVNVGLGVTDVDSPTASAAGGTINYRTITPSNQMGGLATVTAGDFNYLRGFLLLQTGRFGPFGTKAWISASKSNYDKFKGPGTLDKTQFNGKIYQRIGSNGDFVSVAGNYNVNRNNFYRNPSLTDLRNILVTNNISAVPSPSNPAVVGGYGETEGNAINAFENLATCNKTVPGGGVVQNDNGGTGRNGTGATAPAIYGSTANNPLNSSSCSNYFGVRINPSNTGNIRGQSKFTLADGLILTIDPSFQYVLANGGGSTTFSEKALQLRGSKAATVAGVDLNGDGDILDTIRVLSPNNTNTHRIGLTSSLIYDIDPNNVVRVAYTYDRAHHRQTGEYGYLDSSGTPLSPFGGRNSTPILDANGNVLQQRDRTSIALLNQVSGQYIGKFFDQRLRVEIGVRRPFFRRDLDQHCYTFASGSGFAYCSSEVLGTTPIAPAAGNYVVPANYAPAAGTNVPSNAVYAPFTAHYKFGKLLPNVGFTYRVAGPLRIFGSYAKGFSAPRTDNLYRRPFVTIDPEETNAFDLGLRYTTSRVQAQLAGWKIDYKNRIVTSFNQDLGISIDRNVGRVKSYGFDGSVAFQPIRQLNLLALASYTNAKLQQNVEIGSVAYNGTTAPVLTGGTIVCNPLPTSGPFPQSVTTCAPTAGKFVSETPKWQYGGRAELKLGALSMGLQAKRVGSRFATDDNDVKVKGYFTADFDARLNLTPYLQGLPGSYLTVNVINISNKFYFGSLSTQINAAGGPNFAVGAPRTFVASLGIGF